MKKTNILLTAGLLICTIGKMIIEAKQQEDDINEAVNAAIDRRLAEMAMPEGYEIESVKEF